MLFYYFMDVPFLFFPMLHNHKRFVHGKILKDLAAIVNDGSLNPSVDEVEFMVGEVGAAYDRLASGKAIGKVVVSF